MKNNHYSVVIIGGGAAGTSLANDLKKQNASLDIALVEPSSLHYYQPAFTLVGAGAFTLKNATREQKDLLPKGVTWLKEYATSFSPDQNKVTLDSDCEISYDYLVVCPGLQLDFHKIKGLEATLGQNGVCCNYSPKHVEYTWQTIQKMTSGNALFTQPPMPIKCAGAPQKAMYLASDYFRIHGHLNKINVEFFNAGPGLFGVPFFAKALEKVITEYGIKTNYTSNLVEIDGPSKKATFEVKDSLGNTKLVDKYFDMIHVTPPQSSPDFIKESPLSNDAGWLDVDPATLQHIKYNNVFGLGDVIGTTNAKTAAAVRKQYPVVTDNILNLMANKPLASKYTGYGSCPLTTSLSSVMLAEFSYGGEVTPSFPMLDPRKNRYVWWLVKRIGLPWLYWTIMLKGRRIDLPSKASYAKKYIDQ
ncbi:MAG: sulfide:quinone oxidoreductase [Alteromonadaceae bacterium]|jgi:sulfide:quinone oxidoreductase